MGIDAMADLVDELLTGERPLPIVRAGVPVLRQPTLPYEGQLGEERLARLVDAMKECMRAAPGVGLAAPQIGLPLRIAVIEDPVELPPELRGTRPEVPADVREVRGRMPLPFRVLVNPVYEPVGERRVAFFEGCLSVPGWQAVVARPERVRLRCEDQYGNASDEEFSGWPARIVQHETDHLDGTLYLDHAETRSLSTHEAVAQYWRQPSPATAARELGFPLPDTQSDPAPNGL
ncbi:peptide deformylase [Actinacidiphila acidipaludis]|uniref:Peptide deformylase n=1 Tax=Actinacidiphila acidipaludis TaxID=2873382 RepID=A0ABS7Q667_9ACTN|nr:peptide deformylase [Streptomyces acidipaludis]MBY8877244.1 peptide deformylase [Streptomyces acidipaludis]